MTNTHCPVQPEHHSQWSDPFHSDPPRSVPGTSADTCEKGSRVVVAGRLRIRQYETDDGRRGQAAEVDADDLGPSLKFATARLTRTPNSNGAAAGPPDHEPPF